MITELNKRLGPEWAGRATEKKIMSYNISVRLDSDSAITEIQP
jgi:hypothetical protein